MTYNSIKFIVKAGLLLIILFVLTLQDSSNLAHATCIIIYIGKGEILIGADSRSVKKGYNSESLQYLETCKIKRFDNLFFAMSGFTNSAVYNFNPYQLSDELFSSSESFDFKISNLKIELKKRLSEILHKVKTNAKSWQMVVTKEKRILDIAIIGKMNGQFGVYRLGFILTNQETMSIDLQEEMILCTESTDSYYGFGDSEESKKYIMSHLRTEAPGKIIVNAIKAQSTLTPTTVGKPINLLRVKADSFDWLINKCCKD